MKQVKRHIHEIDATGIVLGRLATKVATILRGKHKVNFTYYFDQGDKVVILNPDKIKLTGDKLQQKEYFHYSGYPGGLKRKQLAEILNNDPKQVIKQAVYNMLPKNKLREQMIKRLTFK